MASTTDCSVRLPEPTGNTTLDPAPKYDVNVLKDDRTQALRHLLEEGHQAVAPLRNPSLILHSHLPHLLGSAYALGADKNQLKRTYEHDIKTLVAVDDSFPRGDQVTAENWRNSLTIKKYTMAYVDFFDEEIKKNDGDWNKVVQNYLFSGPEPIVNGGIGGLAHPFIHLAYAYEFNIPQVASQALSLFCTEYAPLHGLLDHYPPDTSTYQTDSLAEVLRRVQLDNRFDGLIEHPGTVDFGIILGKRFQEALEHWNAWKVGSPAKALEHICDMSVLVAISTGDREKKYDFFYAHVMTVSHALRILFHHLPEDRRECILRQYAMYAIFIYILQFRLPFDKSTVDSVPTEGRDWAWVTEKTLTHKWALDDHFFKVVRALKAFAETYGEKDGYYLKAAIKYITEFDGWEGFGLGVEGFLPNRDGYVPE